MELILCLAGFGLTTSVAMAVIKSFSRYETYQARLAALEEKVSEPEGTVRGQRLIKKAISPLSRIFAARSVTPELQFRLLRAGILLKGEEYLTIWLLSIVLLPIVMYLLTFSPWAVPIGMLLGIILPRIYLKKKQDARLQALNGQLCDALVTMANGLRAGFGFQQAMDSVKKELPDPIASEFAWTLREMNLGCSHEEALLNLGKRVGSDDLDMIITGIIIQRQVGGNLAEILENISGTIRERSRIKREIMVLTAQGRLSGLIIGLLPLVLIAVMLLINPDYFNVMIRDIRGIVMLGTAVVLEIIGFILINKITDIDW
ncbi:MAG: type II secretion system F family protein [Deltaproteobacteria bacterium]